jgi:uncharacterized repeat protein (TIGR03803 family)
LVRAFRSYFRSTDISEPAQVSARGVGTVFKITTSGAEGVLYSFAGGSDGEDPEGNLTDVGGVLYGTTTGGGASGSGTVFSLPL